LPFKRGYISFAGNAPNSRSCHAFITLGHGLSSLGTESWETPIGYVEDKDMDNVVAKFYTGYGELVSASSVLLWAVIH